MSKRKKKIEISASIYPSSSSDDESPFIIEQKIEIPRSTFKGFCTSEENSKRARSPKKLRQDQNDEDDFTSSCDEVSDPSCKNIEEEFKELDKFEEYFEENLSLETLFKMKTNSLQEEYKLQKRIIQKILNTNLNKKRLIECVRAFSEPGTFELRKYCELLMEEFLKVYCVFQKGASTELSFLINTVFPKWITYKISKGSLKFSEHEILNNVKSWKRSSLAEFIKENFDWKVDNNSSKQWKIYHHGLLEPPTVEKYKKVATL